jgi:triosephosphate isomerase
MAGNWKMFKTTGEAKSLIKALAPLLTQKKPCTVVVCPPFTSLNAALQELAGTSIKLGAQNIHWESQGAFTGEISASMLKDAACEYVIIGHSERRQYFAETDDSVNRRLKAALASGIIPIVCVGESLAERESNVTESVVERQVRAGFAEIDAESAAAAIIAYEPIWAIGTGRTASTADANAVCAFIRKTLATMYNSKTAEAVRVLYGGSVKPDNIDELMGASDIDGALVGGASIKAADFARIVNFVEKQ